MSELAGRTALVTGATRGIGYQVARRLVEAGQTVYLGARDLRRGAEAGAEIGATPVLLDSTDGASIAAAVDRLRNEVGALDVLVNNAGIAGDQRPPAEATLDDLRRVFETNVFGAAAVLTAFTPLLEASPAQTRDPFPGDVEQAILVHRALRLVRAVRRRRCGPASRPARRAAPRS